MLVPPSYTREQVLSDIEHVSSGLARHMQFGYHTYDDMKQEAFLFALDALKNYDENKSALRTFLYTHIRNQFINMRRKQYARLASPCTVCPHSCNTICMEYEDETECTKYAGWIQRNESKHSLMMAVEVVDQNSVGAMQESIVADAEVLEILDKNLPVALRPDFCRLRDGAPVPKKRRLILEGVINEILGELG